MLNNEPNTEPNTETILYDQSYVTIDGRICKNGQKLGYCLYHLHRGPLDKYSLEQHQCLEKQCPFFEKHADAPYWGQVEREQQRKKDVKQKKKDSKARCEKYLKIIRELTVYNNKFYAIDVEEKDDIFYVKYIKLRSFNYSYYITWFKENCDSAYIRLTEIKASPERKQQIIDLHGITKLPKELRPVKEEPENTETIDGQQQVES